MSAKTASKVLATSGFVLLGWQTLSTPALADAILTIDFVSTDLVQGVTANVLQGNLVIDETTGLITGIRFILISVREQRS